MIPHSKKKCKSFFDMTDKQKKRIVERAARLSIEEQIRKYGSPDQKQESGEWEERFEKLTIECFSSDFKKLKYFTWKFKEHALKSFISTELQEAERRGYERGLNYYKEQNKPDSEGKLHKLLKKQL